MVKQKLIEMLMQAASQAQQVGKLRNKRGLRNEKKVIVCAVAILALLSVVSACGCQPQPAGNRIAFVSDRDGNFEIYMMNADGSNQTRLTNNPAEDGMPAWSPDGSCLAFNSDRDGNFEIYVMDADGSNQTRLTNDPGWDTMPAWSPDGSCLAFNSDRDGKSEIYVMDADGSNQRNLTNNPAWDGDPAWSP